MANDVIKSLKELDKFLSVVAETSRPTTFDVGSFEKSRQEQLSGDLTGLKKSGDKHEVDEAEDEDVATEEETVTTSKGDIASDVPDVTSKELRQASLADITKMLNVLRSGRSLKDPDVKQKLKSYLDGLSDSEKSSLYVFITGLAEIMVAGESGKKAVDPQMAGLKINVKAEPTTPSPSSSKKQAGAPDAPIVVGEVANKSTLLRKFHGLRK